MSFLVIKLIDLMLQLVLCPLTLCLHYAFCYTMFAIVIFYIFVNFTFIFAVSLLSEI